MGDGGLWESEQPDSGDLERRARRPTQNMRNPKASIESAFTEIWSRTNAYVAGGGAVSAALISQWAMDRGLAVTNAQESVVGIFSPIPAVVLDIDGRKACFPLMGKSSPEWITRRAAADRTAELWKKVEWFGPLWVPMGKLGELLKAIEHHTGENAIQHFDYHLSTAYTLPFQAICIAQLLPKTRSLSVFAPLAREAYLAFYSGHRASSVAALIPVIEGGLKRIASATLELNPLDAIDKVVNRACDLAADLHFNGMWVPDSYRSIDFLFGQDERVFVFETFRRWIRGAFFQKTDNYSGVTSLNRHLFAHGSTTDWQQPSNFSRLIVAITTLGVIESWHDRTNAVPILFPEMNEDATLLWQQALMRGQLQMTLNLHEQAYFQAHGRLVPELPTDSGITLRKAILAEDAIKDLVRPLRDVGWSVQVTEPDDEALFVVATATRANSRLSVALLYSCATSNEVYRELASKTDVILYRGSPYHQASFACGVAVHVGPVAGWQPPRAPTN